VSSGTQALPRVCFVHIPKTAGNSIQSFFVRIYGELAFPGHVTEHYDACSESELAGYRYYGGHVERRGWSRLPFDTSIFTVVRHPVDRAVSLYRYWNELDCEANKYIIEGVRVARSRPIEDFVASDNPVVVQHLRGGLARQFLTDSTLTTHLHSVEGQPRAFDEAVKCLFSFSAVLTTERLATSFTKMLECLKIDGLDLPLARENVSSTVVEYDRNLLFSIMARQSPLDFQIYSVCQNLEQRLYAKETAVGARKSRQPRRQALVLDFGQGGNSSAYRRDGWSHQEQQFVWATGGMSSLAWPELPPCQRLMLHFDVVPFIAPPHRSVQRLTVKIGDATVAHVELGGQSAFWVQLPESATPPTGIILEHPDWAVPGEIGVNSDGRALSIAFRRISIVGEPTAPLTEFESLGGTAQGCEFGVVQRMRGAEPIGLLRWSNMTAESLAEALETEFDGVGSPKETVLDYIKHQDGHLEYATANRRLGMEMHTWVASDQVPYDKMFEDSCKRLTLLRRKLIEDLRGGQKLFVFKMGDKTCTLQEVRRIHAALERYGPNTLLYVRLQDTAHPSGTVELVEDRLIIGYIDRFNLSQAGEHLTPSMAAWDTICSEAYELWKG